MRENDHLRYLLHCYYHEDWLMMSPTSTWQGTVRMMVANEPTLRRAIGAAGELCLVLETSLADGDRIYEQYDPAIVVPDMSMREWLVALRDCLGDEVLASGKWPRGVEVDVFDRLESVSLAPSAEAFAETLARAVEYGTEAPIQEVIMLLGGVSLALAPSSPVEGVDRDRLVDLRAAISHPAARRWERTEPYA